MNIENESGVHSKDKRATDASKTAAQQYESAKEIDYKNCESNTYHVIKSKTKVLEGPDDMF